MKRIGFLMTCSVLALALGCDNRPAGDRDSGITLMDGGADPDTGTPPTPDSGMPPSGCTVDVSTGIPPLPAACVPRCASATAMAINTCAMSGGTNEQIAMCQNMAVASDTTPGTTLNIVGQGSNPFNCQGCWNWSIQHCIFESCPSELAACLGCADGCDAATAGCESEETAINSCIMTNQAAIQSCFNTQASRCFG